MDAFKNFLKEVLYPACLVFTLIIFSFSTVYEIIGLSSSPVYTLGGIIQFFAFSLIFAWSKEIFKIKKISYVKALLLHFIAFLGNIILVFGILGNTENFAGMIALCSAIYLLGAIVASIIRGCMGTAKKEKELKNKKKNEYQKLFK